MVKAEDFVIWDERESKFFREYYDNTAEIVERIKMVVDIYGHRIERLLNHLQDGETAFFWLENVSFNLQKVEDYYSPNGRVQTRKITDLNTILCVTVSKGEERGWEDGGKKADVVEIETSPWPDGETVAVLVLERS